MIKYFLYHSGLYSGGWKNDTADFGGSNPELLHTYRIFSWYCFSIWRLSICKGINMLPHSNSRQQCYDVWCLSSTRKVRKVEWLLLVRWSKFRWDWWPLSSAGRRWCDFWRMKRSFVGSMLLVVSMWKLSFSRDPCSELESHAYSWAFIVFCSTSLHRLPS